MTKERVAIVGAGLGGAVMACYLGRAGYEVEVHEKRPDPRRAGAERGRSINLALSTRGLHALSEIGLKDKVLADAIPMRGRMIHSLSGELAFQPYGTQASHVIHSVSRADMNLAVIEAAEKLPNVRVTFGRKAVDADLDEAAVTFEDTTAPVLAEPTHALGSRRSISSSEEPAPHPTPRAPENLIEARRDTVRADFIVGADGAFSTVRSRMQKLDRFEYHQDYLEHGYKELTIPALPGGRWAMEKNVLHIWPRGYFMMIALPNSDGSYTATLFWPFEGPGSFAALKSEPDVLDFFRRTFPDAVPLMPDLARDFLSNPESSLVTVRCRPWRHKDKVVLIGDAAHAVVPFYGQGMNAAFEDCAVLNECLVQSSAAREPGIDRADGRAQAFERFESLRKKQVDALAELALENFIEMRDKTASRMFLMHKHLEKALHRLFPAWYLPLYTMVTFTRMPYAEAARRARRQDRTIALIATIAVIMAVVIASAPVIFGRK